MSILDKTRACQQCRARKPCRLFDYGDGIREWLCYGEDSCYEWASGEEVLYCNWCGLGFAGQTPSKRRWHMLVHKRTCDMRPRGRLMATVKQSCPQGLTDADLDELLGERRAEFDKWMIGQTMSICEGKSYNHELHKYEPTECEGSPHGIVAYAWDVERFLAGLPVID